MSASTVEKIRSISKKQFIDGVQLGRITEIAEDGRIFIDFPGNNSSPIQASVAASAAEIIKNTLDYKSLKALIAFEHNDADRPIIIDVVNDRVNSVSSNVSINRNALDTVKIDGATLTFDAKKEIVLRCGKASITLTRAGKVLIRGAYLSNRSSGVNRIKGGSIQIN
jgi:hypothetical protein